jgi:ATP-dependent Clp protease ATP-binding subunit ClpA
VLRRRRPEGSSSGPFTRFTDRARRVVVVAQYEARDLGHHYLGTEHLLLAIAAQDDSDGGRVLRRLGIDPAGVRTDIVRIIGRGERPRGEPLDRDALASIGIDIDEVRRRVEAAFGHGALDRTQALDCAGAIPFTPRSKRVLELATREARNLGHDYAGTSPLLLALVRESTGVAAHILAQHGIDEATVRTTVLELLAESRG